MISAEQDANGTYIFSGKDMCMIEHIPDLLEAGIDSFKIEGRMKSAYYTACVTNAYKLALRDAQSGNPFNPACMDELNGVSHREYSPASGTLHRTSRRISSKKTNISAKKHSLRP